MAESDPLRELVALRQQLADERAARLQVEKNAAEKAHELYRRQQEVELLHVIAEAANDAKTVNAAIQVAVDEICQHMGWPVGHAFLAQHGPSPELVSSGVWHLRDPARYADFKLATDTKSFAAGEGVVGLVLATRETVWLEDLNQLDGFQLNEPAQRAGLRGAFAFPVRVGPRVVAVLEFYSDQAAGERSVWPTVAQRVGIQLSRVFERKQSELSMQLAMDAAEAGTRAKSEFLATMSHEIRTPMNGIMGFTNLLLESPGSAQQREFLSLIHRSGTSLLSIINDILDFSKIEAGKLTIEEERYDLHATIEEVADLLSQQAEAKGLRIIRKLGAPELRHTVGDAGRVRQILLNLLGNAVKFTEEGHIKIELTCRAVPTGGERFYKIAVIDSGIGIPADKQAALFQKFSQADASTTRKFGGTGLGLAISKRLAARMGGEMGMSSTPGEGSTFWFTLPVKTPVEAPAETASATGLQGLKVLVVDEVEINRRALHEQLNRWGVAHESTATAAEALALMSRAAQAGTPFHLALVDDLIDDLHATKLAAQVRADSALAMTALIILTSGVKREAAARLLEAGFAGTLAKPIMRPVQLLESLSRVARATQVPFPFPASRAPFPKAEVAAAPACRVLLAEDNSVNRKLAVYMLQRLNCNVDVAVDGQEAVDRCHESVYDLIFMDCQMPVLDGLEATAEIRRLESCRNVPIIAVTANAMAGDREKCLAAGMNDYISKPLSKDDLQRALNRWLAEKPATPSPAI